MVRIFSLPFRSCLCSGLGRALAPVICSPRTPQLWLRFERSTTLYLLPGGYARDVTCIGKISPLFRSGPCPCPGDLLSAYAPVMAPIRAVHNAIPVTWGIRPRRYLHRKDIS